MKNSQKRGIQAQDLYKLELINDLDISPDGRMVVFSQQFVDEKTEKKYTNLWLVPADGSKKPFKLTHGKQSDGKPRWSPDNDTILFLSNRDDEKQPQLHLIKASGGEAQPLTELKGEFSDYAWSPDGKSILCQFKKKDQAALDREADATKKELGIVSRRIKNVHFKFDGYGYLPEEHNHLWMINAKTGKATQLTKSETNENEVCWSPNGKHIAYLTNLSEDTGLTPDNIDLFVYDINKKQSIKLQTPIGQKYALSFSPDGQQITYIGNDAPKIVGKNQNLWLVNVDGKSPAKNITAQYDFCLDAHTINDVGSPQMKSPFWLNATTLVFQVVHHGNTALYSVNTSGEEFAPFLENSGVVLTFAFNAAHDTMAYLFGSMTDPCQIFTLNLESKETKQLTEANHEFFKHVALGEVEEVWFKGSDGNDLQGWIIKPPFFDASKKYPSIMQIHGGPQVQYGNFFMHEFNYLSAQGYVVYFCNPRGGTGYGEAHTRAIAGGKWGTVDYQDLMCWADYMQKQPYIDQDRMGVTGGSYGGYMSTWIIGHTQRFKAAVVGRCVSNLVSLWGSSDFNWGFQEIFDDKAPYESIEVLWECSPMKHIGNAKTPTLVLHNEQDLRCPMEQGEQVYVALKTLHVPTELVVFPESPHGLSRIGRTDRRIARLDAMLDWFERYLK